MNPAVTAVVLTLDEARHLPDCLASLSWADDVVVLDSGSTDGTADIARTAGARVAVHPFENYSRQRQHALSLVATPWVLFVDADERVSPALAAEVREVLGAAETEAATVGGSTAGESPTDDPSAGDLARGEPMTNGSAVAYWIPRVNDFWGRRLRGGGWWPDHQLRLLRVDRVRYDPDRAVHEVAAVAGPTGHLTEPLVHLNYDDLVEFRAKQAAYAVLDARRRRAEGQRVRPHNLVLQPLREFWRRYWILEGWRDGIAGWLLCSLMAWYELRTLIHLWRGSSRPPR